MAGARRRHRRARASGAQAVVVMGVSGSGKTTIGKRLARQLGFDFADADRYHPKANIDKMAAGEPLTDTDRRPWLAALRALIEERAARGRSLVLGCSALKRSYREVLSGRLPPESVGTDAAGEAGGADDDAGGEPGGPPAARAARRGSGPRPRVTFVYLRGDYDTILARMRRRQGHYMKADMLASQFRDLEEPRNAVTVDVTGSFHAAVRRALAGLAGRGVTPVRPGGGGGGDSGGPGDGGNEEERP